MAMIAASKDGKNPLEDCGKDMGDAQQGIKVVKAEKGVRGNGNTAMVTCSIQVEIDDVLKKYEEARTEAPVIGDGAKVKPGSYVKLTKLNDTTYRFAADFALPEDKEVKGNPFIPMMLAQSNFSLTLSGQRIENVKGGEVSADGTKVTWKVSLLPLFQGQRQQFQADIVFNESRWDRFVAKVKSLI